MNTQALMFFEKQRISQDITSKLGICNERLICYAHILILFIKHVSKYRW